MSEARIAEVLRRRLGFECSTLGPGVLTSRLGSRLRRLGCASTTEYAARLESDAEELDRLLDLLAVQETWFFRYPDAFAHLEAWARARRDVPARILSVPCASGEEPLSIAATLRRAGLAARDIHIDAVDVGRSAIEAAERGTYPTSAFRSRDPDPRYFERRGAAWSANAELRESIRYHLANVMDWPDGGSGAYDVVFCRNLLIYLTEAARRRVLQRVHGWLVPEGLLYVGHAELWSVRQAGFALQQPLSAFVGRKTSTRSPSAPPAPPLARDGTRRRNHTPARTAGSAALQSGPPTPAPTTPAPAPPRDVLDEVTRLADRGELGTALARLEAARRQGPPTAALFHLLALVHMARGQEVAARHALGRALYLDRAHVPSLVQAAGLAERAGDVELARRYRRRVARLETERGEVE